MTFKCAGCGETAQAKKPEPLSMSPRPAPTGWTMQTFWRQNEKTGQVAIAKFATCSFDCMKLCAVRGKVSDQQWFQQAIKEFFK